jgi:hypothetical protein
VGAAEVGAPEVGSCDVRQGQVRSSEIRADQVRTAKIGAAKIDGSQIHAHEVGPTPIGPWANGSCAGNGTRFPEQDVHAPAAALHVQRFQRLRPATSEVFRLDDRQLQLAPKRTRCGKCQCLPQVPQQFVELADDEERREDTWRHLGVGLPIGPSERFLSYSLARAVAIEGDTARKPKVAQPRMDSAPEVRLKVRARQPRGFVDREIRGGRECGPDAT